MKYIYALGIVFFLSSCSSVKTAVKKKSDIFSPKEKQLILAGKENEPMRILQITDSKDSLVLRSKSIAFNVDNNNQLLQLFTKRLYATVHDTAHRGVGIAAPQVGILKRIIWVQRLDKKGTPFEVYYNPYISKYSEMRQDVLEGCLSIPNTRGTTDRAYAVFIQYDNPRGKHKCEMIEAYTAAIFQHEIDHLNGILFLDHLKKELKKSIKHKIEN